MHKSTGSSSMGMWSAIFLGIGAMVGAGIFALLGQAGAMAHSATYLSFILGGVIALLSGYSLGKLGVRFPSAGGIVEYLVQSFGEGVFSGGMSVALYSSALVALSLIAKAFGSYAGSYFFKHPTALTINLFGAAVVLFFMFLNLRGTKEVALIENLIVFVKLTVLVILGVTGLIYIQPELLSPSSYPSGLTVASSIGVTFFAYEGFRVITNTAEDLKEVKKNLPRAMTIAILIVMALYILLALTVFGNLPLNEIISSKDYALAEVAKPIFGNMGFTIIVITALISTSSAINANLFAVTNVTYQMAKDGELPEIFGRPLGHSKEGLVVTSILVLILMMLFDLSETAIIGSISILFVHAMVHLGHLKIIKKTQASKVLVVCALLGTCIAIALVSWFQWQDSPKVLVYVILFMGLSFLIEYLLHKINNRRVKARL